MNAAARTNFPHKELQGLNVNHIQDKLFNEKNIDWNNLPICLQRGSCCVKREVNGISTWVIDNYIPIFKDEGRNYIEELI